MTGSAKQSIKAQRKNGLLRFLVMTPESGLPRERIICARATRPLACRVGRCKPRHTRQRMLIDIKALARTPPEAARRWRGDHADARPARRSQAAARIWCRRCCPTPARGSESHYRLARRRQIDHIDVLGMFLIERGHKVAVLAVDLLAHRGSILGDKTRMARLSASEAPTSGPRRLRARSAGSPRRPARRCCCARPRALTWCCGDRRHRQSETGLRHDRFFPGADAAGRRRRAAGHQKGWSNLPT